MIKKVFVILFTCFLLFLSIGEIDASYDPRTVGNNIYGAHIVNHSDLIDVANFTNTNGGDWGYVTIVITEDQRDKQIWQKFMDDCRKLHLIPIVRVATKFKDNNWEIPEINEIDNWIMFFNSLNWVMENRYIVIGNEPNHSKEWGGKIDPIAYSNYLKEFSQKIKASNPDYFILPAGFDQDAPNGKNTMDQKKYLDLMVKANPDIFKFIDGWNSHSYPNPGFSGSKSDTGRRSIKGYEWEIELLKNYGISEFLPIFITETGWIKSKENSEQEVADNLKFAYEEIWMKNKNIVAVTPFILNYTEEPFADFSWKKKDGTFFPIYTTMQNNQKIKGSPVQKINGDVIFTFLNPLIIKNTDQKGFLVVRNTGQAIWTQSESNVINEQALLINEQALLINESERDTSDLNEIKISNTKFSQIEPFNTGLVVYTLHAPNETNIESLKLGFYVKGERIGDIFTGKIISF